MAWPLRLCSTLATTWGSRLKLGIHCLQVLYLVTRLCPSFGTHGRTVKSTCTMRTCVAGDRVAVKLERSGRMPQYHSMLKESKCCVISIPAGPLISSNAGCAGVLVTAWTCHCVVHDWRTILCGLSVPRHRPELASRLGVHFPDLSDSALS
jgi:hypothetical protein